MKKLFVFFAFAQIGLSACNSTFTKSLSSPMYAPKAEINPIRADVDVDMNKKITGESHASYFLIFKVSQDDNKYAEGINFTGDGFSFSKLNKLKSAAAFKAINSANCDIIVHPNYIVQKHNYLFFSTYEIKVSGYAGNFKKFYQEPYDKDNQTHHADNLRNPESKIRLINEKP
jgi:hypothetical protein